jgi:hypothetical protein
MEAQRGFTPSEVIEFLELMKRELINRTPEDTKRSVALMRMGELRTVQVLIDEIVEWGKRCPEPK